MTSRDLVKPTMFLVVTGSAPARDLVPNASAYQFGGLTLQLPTATGSEVDLVISSDDLADFADMTSAALCRTVCLPLAITALGPNRLTCRMSQSAAARRLAQRILAVLTA